MAEHDQRPPGGVTTCAGCRTRNRVPARAGGHPRCGRCREPLPWIVSAGDGDFAEVAEQARGPVLVDLWAPWCGPCHVVSPMIERIAAERAGRLKVVKVDVDQNPEVAARFGVQGIPTLLLLHGGRVVQRQTGAPPEPALRAWVDQGLTAAT